MRLGVLDTSGESLSYANKSSKWIEKVCEFAKVYQEINEI